MPKTKVIKQGRRKKADFETEEETVESPKQARRLRVAENHDDLKSLHQKIAGHPMCHRNWAYRGSRTIFPDDLSMQLVSWYFPYAAGGALYIDDVAEGSADKYEIKSLAFKEFKIGRYCYLTPGMTVEQALEQMGEI